MDPPGQEQRQDPSWAQLAAVHWRQYAVAAGLLAALALVDTWEPRQRAIYHKSDAELWMYSFPLMEGAAPAWAVPLVSLYLPLVLLAAAAAAGRLRRVEAHHAGLNLLACVAATGLSASLLNSQVGRPRPDFVARCWPTTEPSFSAEGFPRCEPGVRHQTADAGLRSFPSVHAAWSAAGLGFVCLWLLGRLRCFTVGGAQPARLVAALSPLFVVGAVGVAHVRSNRHHVTDVLAAYAMGASLAVAFFLQTFDHPFGARAGCLVGESAAAAAAPADEQQAAGYAPIEAEEAAP